MNKHKSILKKRKSNKKKKMIRSLHEYVLPQLRSMGFSGMFPHLRREMPDRLNLLTFHFDRQGGGFVMDIVNCNTEGFRTPSGLMIAPDKLTAHDFADRLRIKAKMKGKQGKKDWFRYDRLYLLGFGDITKKLCLDVIVKLEVAKDHWENGNIVSYNKSFLMCSLNSVSA